VLVNHIESEFFRIESNRISCQPNRPPLLCDLSHSCTTLKRFDEISSNLAAILVCCPVTLYYTWTLIPEKNRKFGVGTHTQYLHCKLLPNKSNSKMVTIDSNPSVPSYAASKITYLKRCHPRQMTMALDLLNKNTQMKKNYTNQVLHAKTHLGVKVHSVVLLAITKVKSKHGQQDIKHH